MLKKTPLILLIAVFTALSVGILVADPISVGDVVRFTDREGTSSGGEFGVRKLDPITGTWLELFRTFCLERNEYIAFNTSL